MSTCGYGWEDALNVPRHPRHRCTDETFHKGIHMCGTTYTDENGKRVYCGAVRNR